MIISASASALADALLTPDSGFVVNSMEKPDCLN